MNGISKRQWYYQDEPIQQPKATLFAFYTEREKEEDIELSWRMYWNELQRKDMENVYIPDPEEIEQRKKELFWLTEHFVEPFIKLVMYGPPYGPKFKEIYDDVTLYGLSPVQVAKKYYAGAYSGMVRADGISIDYLQHVEESRRRIEETDRTSGGAVRKYSPEHRARVWNQISSNSEEEIEEDEEELGDFDY